MKTTKLIFYTVLCTTAAILQSCTKLATPQTNADQAITDTKFQVSATAVLNVDPGPGNGANGSPILSKTAENTTCKNLYQSDLYKVEVALPDGIYKEAFVYKINNANDDVKYGSLRGEKTAHYTDFSFANASYVTIKITLLSGTGTSIKVRPSNYGITASSGIAAGKTFYTFRLTTPQYVSIEINDVLNPLMIFGDKPEVNPPTQASHAGYIYFGRGLTHLPINGEGVGEQTITSNQKVYIAPGAIVDGRFFIPDNNSNISFTGRGIISMGNWPFSKAGIDVELHKRYAEIRGYKSSYITIDGLIFTNATSNMISIEGNTVNNQYQCHNNHFNNYKAVCFNLCSDTQVDGDQNSYDNWFIFSDDDIMYSHGIANSTATNINASIGESGRIFVVDNYNNSNFFTMDNVNVVHMAKNSYPAGSIMSENSNLDPIHPYENNFTFKNIRFEHHTKKVVNLVTTNQSLYNWQFINIQCDDALRTGSGIEGIISGTSNSQINGVKFMNLTFAGIPYTNNSAGNITIGPYVTGVQFLP